MKDIYYISKDSKKPNFGSLRVSMFTGCLTIIHAKTIVLIIHSYKIDINSILILLI